MTVFRALLARTSTLTCIFITIMACHEQTPWILLYLIMMLFVFTTLQPVLKAPNRGKVWIVLFYILFLINFVQIIFLTHDRNRLDFLNENALPYFQFRSTLSCIYFEVISVWIFLFRLFRILGVKLKVFLVWLIYISIHAIFVVFIIDCVVVNIYNSVYQNILGNFFCTFDERMISKYPISYFNHDVLNATTFESPVRRAKLFSLEQAHNRCLWLQSIEEKQVKDMEGNYLPYTYSRASRYLGEDVEFICQFAVKYGEIQYKETFWKSNNRRIWNKARNYYLNTYGHFNLATNLTVVTSTLRVVNLRKSDFGTYMCICVSVYEGMSDVYQSESTIEVYELQRIEKTVDIIYKTVGNLIATRTFFFFHTFEDVHDVYFEYTVNGQNIDQECAGLNDRTCSVGTGFLLSFRDYKMDHYPFFELKEYIRDIKRAVTFFCLCGKAFGVHKVTFVRKLKSENGNMVWVDAENPFVFVVLPQANRSMFQGFSEKHLYTEIEDIVASGGNETTILRKLNEQIKFIDAHEQHILNLANAIQSILFVLSLMVSIILFKLTVQFYCFLFIRIPVLTYINRIPITYENESISKTIDISYDVFISHSGSEDIFVKDKLLPFLEGHCKQRACFPERDFVPGELETQQYTANISRSRKIIVLLSGGYRKDSLCHNFQLERIILPMLYEQKLSNAQVLFVLFDNDAEFPKTLRWDLETEKLDWRTHLPEKSKLINVKVWLDTGKVQ